MKYMIMVFPLLVSLYLLSFAKYNWSKSNRKAAVGIAVLAAAVIVMPFLAL